MSLFGLEIPQLSIATGTVGMVFASWIAVFVFYFYTQVGGLWRERVISLAGACLVMILLSGAIGAYVGLLILNPGLWPGVPVLLVVGPCAFYGIGQWIFHS